MSIPGQDTSSAQKWSAMLSDSSWIPCLPIIRRHQALMIDRPRSDDPVVDLYICGRLCIYTYCLCGGRVYYRLDEHVSVLVCCCCCCCWCVSCCFFVFFLC